MGDAFPPATGSHLVLSNMCVADVVDDDDVRQLCDGQPCRDGVLTEKRDPCIARLVVRAGRSQLCAIFAGPTVGLYKVAQSKVGEGRRGKLRTFAPRGP